MSQDFAEMCRDIWEAQELVVNSVEVSGVQVAVKQWDILLVSAVAWFWLTQDCVHKAQEFITELLLKKTVYNQSEDWFCVTTEH